MNAYPISYSDPYALQEVAVHLRKLPPLVGIAEVNSLKSQIREAQRGERFLLQGGHCAESFKDCEPRCILKMLAILFQMSCMLNRGGRPITVIGRLAGQYAKPRSRFTEMRQGVELPNYFGDLVNGVEFSASARNPDPFRLLQGYQCAALTLNFIRSFSRIDIPADAHVIWDLFFDEKEEPENGIVLSLPSSISFARLVYSAERLKKSFLTELKRPLSLFMSHEGLHLEYESAQTYALPHTGRCYDLTTHFPWIGERTRQLEGAHVEFFRGVCNPVGVKLGPQIQGADLIELLDRLNPSKEEGKMVLIPRLGLAHVEKVLPSLVDGIRKSRHPVLWMTDPMHGNTHITSRGIKTRRFEDIRKEVELSLQIHREGKSCLGGIHFEFAGENVTECIDSQIQEEDLLNHYSSLCDPRLNPYQAFNLIVHLYYSLK
ncbi:hypothetical protein BCY86_08780 [Pajaroellobacter abortibovis]|uniref:Phospho-2-dehydro-3-deoxyheptonate aldolase n=1 Tax=Pajaroellobacter abortibovis TaxID=1882918 RepID=A0A1L6MZH5_9BACT|nr:hypothetical protein BCY86_08780 [Pajaroellobacter abortibovis]